MPVNLNPAEEIIQLGFLSIRFLLTGEFSNGTIAAFELTVPASQRLPIAAHFHNSYEETIYGITGTLTWTVDGKVIDLHPSQALCIPRGAVHRFDNNGSEAAKALCVITPAKIGPQYFRETADVLNEAKGGPPDKSKLAEIMHRHGLTAVVPK